MLCLDQLSDLKKKNISPTSNHHLHQKLPPHSIESGQYQSWFVEKNRPTTSQGYCYLLHTKISYIIASNSFLQE